MNRNLVHRRIRNFAVVIVSMLMETTPQCDAQQTTNKFTEPSGEALPHIRTVAPKIFSVGNISARATRPKIAFALGGGGMRGAAHVGVLRTFVKAGIPIDIIVGTSIGAIVGGLYSTGIDVDNLEKKFVDGSLTKSLMPLPTIPFAAVALNLVDGKTYALRRGNLGAALRASSAVPGLCEPVGIGEQLFVDGGVLTTSLWM
ncbi:MAG: patatin-like phospholipase family protein [Chthonomonadales bacterium]